MGMCWPVSSDKWKAPLGLVRVRVDTNPNPNPNRNPNLTLALTSKFLSAMTDARHASS